MFHKIPKRQFFDTERKHWWFCLVLENNISLCCQVLEALHGPQNMLPCHFWLYTISTVYTPDELCVIKHGWNMSPWGGHMIVHCASHIDHMIVLWYSLITIGSHDHIWAGVAKHSEHIAQYARRCACYFGSSKTQNLQIFTVLSLLLLRVVDLRLCVKFYLAGKRQSSFLSFSSGPGEGQIPFTIDGFYF